ncbi:MAG: hypothetical protein JWR21_239 [Herminiimonas sp.]|nr:hypothetical protein [Herminiimonas sp.]MDB5852657.1 hypothetical protein [Herminiimonas sp.]
MDVACQVQHLLVRWGGKEATNLREMVRGGNSDKHALRRLPQESIQVDAHWEISGTANAARRNAHNGQAWNRAIKQAGLTIGESFEKYSRNLTVLQPGRNRSLAVRGCWSEHQGALRQGGV